MTTMTMTRALPSVRTQAFAPASRPAPRRISRAIVAKGTGPGLGTFNLLRYMHPMLSCERTYQSVTRRAYPPLGLHCP